MFDNSTRASNFLSSQDTTSDTRHKILKVVNGFGDDIMAAIAKCSLFSQLLKDRLGYVTLNTEVEAIRSFGSRASNWIKFLDYLEELFCDGDEDERSLFTDATTACDIINSAVSDNTVPDNLYGLNKEEFALLSSICGNNAIRSIYQQLFATFVLSSDDNSSKSTVGLRSMLDAASGDSSVSNDSSADDVYIISYDKDNSILNLQSKWYSAKVPVDGFDIKTFYRRILNKEKMVKALTEAQRTHFDIVTDPNGIHSRDRETNWTDLLSCWKEDGFEVAYSGRHGKILYRSNDAKDGKYVFLLCAVVEYGKVLENEMLLFPLETLIRISGGTQWYEDKYIISNNVMCNLLHFQSGEDLIQAYVDDSFSLYNILSQLSDDSSAMCWYDGSIEEAYAKYRICYGSRLVWSEVQSMFLDSGYEPLWSSVDVKMLGLRMTGDSGDFVIIYIACLTAGIICNNVVLLYPMDFIKKRLSEISVGI